MSRPLFFMSSFSPETLILGTRGSELALTQTEMVTRLLQEAHPHLQIRRRIIATAGDKRPDLRFADFSKGDDPVLDKGIFIKELELALESGEIDAAVHSLKDVPSDLSAQFALPAILARAAVEDVLVTREPCTLDTLPSGARVGTSSVRRARQIKWLRPDVEIVEIRGNVPTRIKKVLGDQALDAVMLAAAGLVRLGLINSNLSRVHLEGSTIYASVLETERFLPAAGQGAIAIETRRGDHRSIKLVTSIDDAPTHSRVTAEREFLRILGAGCQTPVGARTWIEQGRLHMNVRVFSETDPTAPPFESSHYTSLHTPKALAAELANRVLKHA